MNDPGTKVRTPLFPLYSWVRALLPIFNGQVKSDVTHLIQAIWEQTGTPQNPVDWTEPDKWIEERLKGGHAKLARHIWEASGHLVNPRHMYGAYLFINGFELLSIKNDGLYELSEDGKNFLKNDLATLQTLDEAEGILKLLSILSTKKKAKRGDLVPEWAEYLQEYSKFTTPGTFKDTLSRRISNLVERNFVAKDGNTYDITEDGLKYFNKTAPVEIDSKRDVLLAVDRYNKVQREALFEALSAMHPYQFEHLISELLEAIGYEDVTVTKASGDKGVDVVATVQFGITTITEVVQVKRTPNSSIARPILDQLRGSLPYHHAIRGTLITLGTISKGAKEAALFPGAAPITLIDGEKLLDMLIEHKVGIKKRDIPMFEVDAAYFDEKIQAQSSVGLPVVTG
jgi:restriction system protein